MDRAAVPMWRFALETVGPRGVGDAWARYWGSEPTDVDPQFADQVLDEVMDDPEAWPFMVWFLLQWTPSRPSASPGPQPDDTIVASYVARHGRRLSKSMLALLDDWRHAPFSFYEVREVWSGKGALLQDLILDRQVFVCDEPTPHPWPRWAVTLAQLVPAGDDHLLGALAPYLVPRDRLPELDRVIRSVRRAKPRAPQDLVPHALRLFEAYHNLDLDRVPAPPMLETTSGEALVWVRTEYRIDSRKRGEVLRELAAMFTVDADEDPVGGTVGGRSGQRELQWVWLDEPGAGPLEPATVLGRLAVKADALVTECMSRERDDRLRAALDGRLGRRIEHVGTVAEPIDAARLAEMAARQDAAPGSDTLSPEELRAVEAAVMGQAIRGWADEPVPALDGKTPRQAVKSAAGRRAVSELIKGWEGMLGRREADLFRADFDDLRSDLGLDLD